jgi:hypothetical protein
MIIIVLRVEEKNKGRQELETFQIIIGGGKNEAKNEAWILDDNDAFSYSHCVPKS